MSKLDYQEIRSNQEFIHGIKRKISFIEIEEKERARVKERNRKLFIGSLKFYLTSTLASFLFLYIGFIILKFSGVIYLWSILICIIVTLYQNVAEIKGGYGEY